MPNPIKHEAFTYDDEKVQAIAKNLEVLNKKQAVLGQFTSPNAEIAGDRLIKRRQVLIDPVAVARLDEGDTPREDEIKIVTFSEELGSYGSYIAYTRHAKMRNRDSVLDMARRQLSHNRLFDIETVRFTALNSTTYTLAAVTESSKVVWWDTLTNLRIRLAKNGARPPFVFFCPIEVEAAIAKEAKAAGSLIQSTAEGESLFKQGYVGDYAGFHIVHCTENYIYGASNAYNCYGIGKTDGGMWPVVENKLGEGNIEVILHDIGDGGHQDPTDEIGTIALRIDYVGAYLEHPECVIKLTGVNATSVMAKVAKDVPEAYKLAPNADTKLGAGQDNAEFQMVIAGGADFKASVAVVAAADGTAIASPTVVIKKNNSSGDTVSAGADGKYTLTPGLKYYFSVSKSSYTTKTGTFIADPTAPELTVALATA